MILALCVDDKGGMAFGGRRQSMDRVLRADLLAAAGDRPLRMNPYTARQFDPLPPNAVVGEDFLQAAGEEDLCFTEFPPLAPYLKDTKGIILYRWNRVYPADARLDFDPVSAGFVLRSTVEFPGHSHKLLTKEVYTR